MILENPIGLWALTAIIAVLILHRLRQRPERLQVSSLIIWKRIERLLTAAPVRRKSRLYLILMLQILAVICLALALARPIWRATQPEPLHLVFLIDNSASLSSVYHSDGKTTTRLELLKEQIKSVLDKVPNDTNVVVHAPEFSLEGYKSIGELNVKDDLDNLRVNNIPSDVEGLVSRIQGVRGELYYCSDKMPTEAILAKLPKKPHLILVGQPSTNVAIIRAAATPTSGKADYYDVFVVVKNYSRDQSAQVKLNLVFLVGDSMEMELEHREIDVQANKSQDVVFKDVPLPKKPKIKISIMPDNPYDLACDNQVLLLPPQPCRVNIAGKDNPALTKALKSLPFVSLNSPSESGDISIFNETLPVTLPAKAIVINSIPETKAFWEYQGRLERPLVTGIDTSSPILKYCDFNVFNNIPYAPKLLPKEKEYIKPIITANNASGDECVLIGEWQKEDKHLVFLNFPLEWRNQDNPTDWTLTPSFPIFWTNLINYLHPVSKDYTLGAGLCNEAESDNNGVTVLDTALPAPEQIPQMETSRVELGHWPIIAAGLCLILGWLLAKR